MFGICIRAGSSRPGVWKTLDIMPDRTQDFLSETDSQPDPAEYREVSFPEWYAAIQESRKARAA